MILTFSIELTLLYSAHTKFMTNAYFLTTIANSRLKFHKIFFLVVLPVKTTYFIIIVN